MNNKFKKLISVSLVMLLLITSTSIFSTSVSAATTYNMKVGETITVKVDLINSPNTAVVPNSCRWTSNDPWNVEVLEQTGVSSCRVRANKLPSVSKVILECTYSYNVYNPRTNVITRVASASAFCYVQVEESVTPTTATVPTTATPIYPTSPITTQATQATSPTGGIGSTFLQNNAGWSNPHCYMWNSDSDKNAAWPGVKMTDLGDGVFEYVVPKSYGNIIFNNGGSPQTGDLAFPGVNNIYNNSTGQWEPYSTGPVKISSFTTDVKSPSYTTCGIKISAAAKSSEGDVTYKFSVNGTVLSDGAASSVVWVPTSAGDYTLTVDVTDTAGNENSRSMSFVIKDASTLESAFIRAFSNSLGTNVQIKKNSSVTFTNDAIGGAVGTNLLFYKFVITDPDGANNIPYYTLDNKYTFTPSKLGVYTIKAYVQNSMNDTTYKTYQYNCVDVIDENPDTTLPSVTTPSVTTPSVTTPSVTTPSVTTPPETEPTQPSKCSHANTKTIGAKKATYFAKGYTGDKVCADCGEAISYGSTVNMKVLKTPKVTVKGAKKAIKVTYSKVKDAKGFTVTYKLGKKTYTKKFTLSKKDLKKAKVTKTIKVKKSGKYKVTVKAFITSGKKTAYSKATSTKTVKVK